ncbi:MAG: DUF1700 domain-containing protein [Clostridia bacterium]|nr:DUF1700 domain-containing protein [Clostridia bacterium]
MNKKEFVNYLENRLSVLNKNEREDIISEYVQHIDNKLKEGLTEKEAVETLGSIEDMVREILSAYNVDPDYGNKEENEINTVVTGIFSRFMGIIKAIGDYILGQHALTLLKLVIKTLVIFFVLWICFMIGLGIASIFGEMVGEVIGAWDFVRFVVRLIYIIIALPTVIYIFIRFLAFNIYGGKEKFESLKAEENIKNKATEIKDSINDKAAEIKETINTKRNNRVRQKANKIFDINADYSFSNIIKKSWDIAFKAFIIMCKAALIMCLIPCVMTLVFTVIAFGALLIFTILGYPLMGAAIACLGFNMAGISLLLIIVRIVFFNKKGVADNE